MSRKEVFLLAKSGIESISVKLVINFSGRLKALVNVKSMAFISFSPTVSFIEIETVSLSI